MYTQSRREARFLPHDKHTPPPGIDRAKTVLLASGLIKGPCELGIFAETGNKTKEILVHRFRTQGWQSMARRES